MELEICGITKQYKDKCAVDGVTLTLTPGVWGLLGANGAGKTTLMRMIAGIQRPTSGSIRYDGIEIGTLKEAYRDIFGYLPQEFGFYPGFCVQDYLEYIAALKGLTKEETKERIGTLLERVSLSKVRNKKISRLSGGMKRRVGIAQALLNDPEILVLDEPTAGLDPKERIRFRNMISTFSKGRIIILSTHIVSDVDFIADQILLMKQGRIVGQGTCGEVTESVRGRVWEYVAEPEEAQRLNKKFAVSGLRNEAGSVHLRLIANECPCEGALPVEPGLEDVYLYYFEEASEYVQDLERGNA